MARTTTTAVSEILSTSLTTPQLQAFIEDVSLWVTEELASLSPAQSSARLEIIERYLACAMIKLRELSGYAVQSVTVGDVSETYKLPAEVRDYLDTAAGFDASGTVRKHFLAPRPLTPLFQAKFRFGKSFTTELPTELPGL